MIWLSPQMAAVGVSGLSKARSQELHLCPTWVVEAQVFQASSAAFSGALEGTWIGNGAAKTSAGIHRGY